jgi:hypothetical protein
MISKILKNVPSTKNNDALKAILATSRQWHIEYGGFLSNHITHNWVVLGYCGKSISALHEWQEVYCKIHPLEPAIPASASACKEVVTEENFRTLLGNDTKNLYPVFLPFFDSMVELYGIPAAVHRFAPTLYPGMLGAALHPTIHLGFALEVDSGPMVAEGLAYLASAYTPLPGQVAGDVLWVPGSRGIINTANAFFELHTANNFYATITSAIDTEKYKSMPIGKFQRKTRCFCDPDLPLAAALNNFGPVELPAVDESLSRSLEEAVVLATAYYLGSKSEFFVVHIVTSLHAVIVTLQYLDPSAQRNALAQWFKIALVALSSLDFAGSETANRAIDNWRHAYATPCSSPSDAESTAWWQDTLDKSQLSSEEHISKSVFVLWRWYNCDLFSSSSRQLFIEAAQQQVRTNEAGRIEDNIWFV